MMPLHEPDSHHERAGSELAEIHEQDGRYFDAVGRPRKFAMGAMKAIQREFSEGTATTRELSERYGCSISLILTICYMTPKGAPRTRPAPAEKRQVVIPDDSAE
jgi:hypothetical protein